MVLDSNSKGLWFLVSKYDKIYHTKGHDNAKGRRSFYG